MVNICCVFLHSTCEVFNGTKLRATTRKLNFYSVESSNCFWLAFFCTWLIRKREKKNYCSWFSCDSSTFISMSFCDPHCLLVVLNVLLFGIYVFMYSYINIYFFFDSQHQSQALCIRTLTQNMFFISTLCDSIRSDLRKLWIKTLCLN